MSRLIVPFLHFIVSFLLTNLPCISARLFASLKLDPFEAWPPCVYQLPQILAHNIMVQKYGVCIEVGVVKIVAYNRANQWQFFYLAVFSFYFLGSASQFTNVPLGEYIYNTVWASFCNRDILSFSSPSALFSILTRILFAPGMSSRSLFFRIC